MDTQKTEAVFHLEAIQIEGLLGGTHSGDFQTLRLRRMREAYGTCITTAAGGTILGKSRFRRNLGLPAAQVRQDWLLHREVIRLGGLGRGGSRGERGRHRLSGLRRFGECPGDAGGATKTDRLTAA